MSWQIETEAGLRLNIRRSKTSKKAVWLFHGYGANEQDLAGVADYMDPDGVYTWILPQGPYEVGFGPYMVGRSWFDLDVPTIQESIAKGDKSFLEREISPALAKSSADLIPKVAVASAPFDEVVFAGFSQGSFVAFDLFLSLLDSTEFLVRTAMLFSTAMARPRVWAEKITQLDKQTVFQSHGLEDPVLPFAGAQRLKDSLEKARDTSGLTFEFEGFQGGHEIPASALDGALRCLPHNQGE